MFYKAIIIDLLLFLLNFIICLNVVICNENGLENMPDRGKIYFDKLCNAEKLTSGRIYEEGSISENAYYFSYLYFIEVRKDPGIFKKLFINSKTEVGKIYALIAMHELEKKNYEIYKRKLNLNKKITILWFCITYELSIREILNKIENDKIIEDILLFPLPKEFNSS